MSLKTSAVMTVKPGVEFKKVLSWTIAMILAVFWLFITFTPFVFMVLNSFKEQFEMLVSGVFTLPKSLYFGNYKTVLDGAFLGYFLRSVIVTSVSLLLMVALSSFASYPNFL